MLNMPKFKQLFWSDVKEGQQITELVQDITYKMAIMHVGAGWDYMPGHHEPEYARGQGVKNVFLNTLFHQSFVDRVMIEWAGPLSFISRRKISMKGSIYPGDRLSGTGKVLRAYIENDDVHKVDLDIKISNQEYLCCAAEGTLILPVALPPVEEPAG